ncbi:hypothetical protein [Actinoplanes aureus]|uniref:Uncharacterized protein n=1 Tax=Actinoplanes aureus TaxID=2792083 RepID=A0A931CC77_9ACTN|nr:hypothetical protein [Actinoplanes aureus]MBG0567245.1 hypothetical protein [Actinoplanes aureus]
MGLAALGVAGYSLAENLGLSNAQAVGFGAASVAVVLIFGASLTAVGYFRGRKAAIASKEAFRAAADRVVTSVQPAPTAEASLDEELAEVATSLTTAVSRLRQLSARAEAFEAEVQALVTRAEAAKATASLHEEDARRIAQLLGAESESRLRHEIAKLTTEHNEQLDKLRRSANRSALWTFTGGVLLGLMGNVVVALWLG